MASRMVMVVVFMLVLLSYLECWFVKRELALTRERLQEQQVWTRKWYTACRMMVERREWPEIMRQLGR